MQIMFHGYRSNGIREFAMTYILAKTIDIVVKYNKISGLEAQSTIAFTLVIYQTRNGVGATNIDTYCKFFHTVFRFKS